LLPILNLMTSRRIVFVGGAGRGKTTMATLMALLAGYELKEIRHAIQHGHPQLTASDLLGGPLPSELVRATEARDIKVSWRSWITMRVKIVDEYNRIPTKTQSALLSLLAEGYAEMYERVVECGRSAWYLTANDELGGGTFPVIEALRDRIDVVVRSTPFHREFLSALSERLESARTAEELVPHDLTFSEAELDTIDVEVRKVSVSLAVLDVLGFFLAQLDFCRRASDRVEYMSKDTLHLAGRRVGAVCNEDCPLDKHENLCSQTEAGVSARAYQSLLHFAKALAYFRGATEVSLDDIRALVPWVLLDRLRPNAQSAFFQKIENKVLLLDRATWIRELFDRASAQHAAYAARRKSTVAMRAEIEEGIGTFNAAELRRRITAVERSLETLATSSELNGPVHQDMILLKSLHGRLRDRLADGGRR
jgi:MoxR-like ATPase